MLGFGRSVFPSPIRLRSPTLASSREASPRYPNIVVPKMWAWILIKSRKVGPHVAFISCSDAPSMCMVQHRFRAPSHAEKLALARVRQWRKTPSGSCVDMPFPEPWPNTVKATFLGGCSTAETMLVKWSGGDLFCKFGLGKGLSKVRESVPKPSESALRVASANPNLARARARNGYVPLPSKMEESKQHRVLKWLAMEVHGLRRDLDGLRHGDLQHAWRKPKDDEKQGVKRDSDLLRGDGIEHAWQKPKNDKKQNVSVARRSDNSKTTWATTRAGSGRGMESTCCRGRRPRGSAIASRIGATKLASGTRCCRPRGSTGTTPERQQTQEMAHEVGDQGRDCQHQQVADQGRDFDKGGGCQEPKPSDEQFLQFFVKKEFYKLALASRGPNHFVKRRRGQIFVERLLLRAP